MPREGLEPSRPYDHIILSDARLPISPPGLVGEIIAEILTLRNQWSKELRSLPQPYSPPLRFLHLMNLSMPI